jgi:hypothetical protein
MKVKIKNYATFFGPYQFMDWLFWPIGKQGLFGNREYPEWHDTLSERYADSWLGTSHTWLAEKWTEYWGARLVSIKLDPWDTWNMDATLAMITAPMLKQLKETKHGAPLVDDEDVPEHLRSTAAPPKKDEWDIDNNHFLRWDWVMDEMIFAFEKIAEDNWQSEFYSGEVTFEATFDESSDVKDTFKVDLEGIKKVRDRIDNGTRLFGKYYSGLWD